jgi:hypothetical protein
VTVAPKYTKRPAIPLSEDRTKITDRWTPDQCVEEIRRIALLDTDKIVSRNYFRVHSSIAESVWSEHFGTFDEFKRQAGIKLTRQQHKHERNIAKHASVDHYRAIGAEREGYGEKYLRDKEGRFKTILAASDLHDQEIDPFFLRVLIDTAHRVQPDVLSLVGDVFDLPEFGKYPVDPREWDAVGRINFARKEILTPLREAAPECQFDLLEGNHEARMLRMLADATPAMRSVLANIHGMTTAKLFKLDELEINYVAKADLGTYTERDFNSELRNNYRVYYECFLAYHYPDGRNMGLPGVNGHHHSHQVWPSFSPIFGAFEWHQLGAGHKRSASYCKGEKWHNGFALAHIDTYTRSVIIEYVPITDFACVGGKFYYRDPAEVVTKGPILI